MSPSTCIVRLCATCLGLATVGVIFAVVAAAAAAAEQTPAAAAAGGAEAPAIKVTIDNFTFAPATLRIKAGTKVTWINRDDIPHTVVDTGAGFKSQVLDTDDTFTHTFEKPGDVEYFCSLHPHMTGHIVVQ